MKQFIETLPRRLMWIFAGMGLSSLGIPFGGIFARLLDGISFGAAKSADVIRYFSDGETATFGIQEYAKRGAIVQSVWTDRESGQIAVKMDTTNYVDIEIADDTIHALENDWI